MNILNTVRLLSDKSCLEILELTRSAPYSAQDISRLLEIPIARTYRRVRQMEREGLLKCVGKPLTREGRRHKIFRPSANNITVVFERGKISIKKNLIQEVPVEEEIPIVLKIK